MSAPTYGRALNDWINVNMSTLMVLLLLSSLTSRADLKSRRMPVSKGMALICAGVNVLCIMKSPQLPGNDLEKIEKKSS